MKAKALLESINEANNIVMATDRFLEQNKDALSEEQVTQILALKAELQASTKGENKDSVEAAMQAINVYTEPLAHEALDRNIGKALKETKL